MTLPVLNSQPPESPAYDRGDGAVEVFKIFRTVQGEGPFTGKPAVFVRLSGCQLQCPGCDTDYTSRREVMTPEQVLSEVLTQGGAKIRLIVLTGGEPFRQGIGPLVTEAVARGYAVQIETNGGLFRHDLPYGDPLLSVVCSPKLPRVHPQLARRINAYKYVLDADHVDPNDGLPTEALGSKNGIARPHPESERAEVFVQPMDVQDPAGNERHLKAAIDSCLKFGWRLSVQTHKIAGLE